MIDALFKSTTARGIAGAGSFILTLVIFALIAWDRSLAENDLFKTLAQAVIVQGLVGLAMAHWFTANPKPPPVDEETQP